MNKILLVGRLVRDPETHQTQSGIKYSRFSIAVDRPFGEDQTDFIPIVAWRSQSDFVEKYVAKGALVSVEGRFNSSSYQNADGQNVTRYEVAAERVQALETKAQVEARKNSKTQDMAVNKPSPSVAATQVIKFSEENKPEKEDLSDVPWDLDL